MSNDHSEFLASVEPALAKHGKDFSRFVAEAALENLMPKRPIPRLKFRLLPKVLPKITDIQPTDIVFGRGNLVSRFHGNWLFRQCIGVNKEIYKRLHKEDKGIAAQVLIWHFEQVGARFLEVAGAGYTEVDYPRVYEKFCQGLRERKYALSGLMPQVRSKLKQTKPLRQGYVTPKVKYPERKSRKNKKYMEDSDSEYGKPAKKRKLGPKASSKQTKAKKTNTSKASTKKTLAKKAIPRTAPPVKPPPNLAPTKVSPTKVSPATPVTHQLMLSPPRENVAIVTPPVDGVATVSLGSNDTGLPGLLYQSPGSVMPVRKLNPKKQDEERAIIRAFRESFQDSARYAHETMKRHWCADMESYPADHEAENLVHILRPCRLRKLRPSAMLPLPVFHDHE